MKTTTLFPCVALLAASAANAADLPARKAGPDFVPPPPFFFEGPYVGAQAGYAAFGDRMQSLLAPNNVVLDSTRARGGSFIGGAHLGYDWHSGPIVYGLVGDVSGAGGRNNTNDLFFGYGVQNTMGVQGSIRGRLGLNYERALLYVTGGLEAAGHDHAYQAPLDAMTNHYVLFSTTFGAGVEYAFDPRWSANVEYRTFGARTQPEAASFVQPLLATRHQQGESMITTGMSYRFGR
jgi:outer membrane immunogenic protein